jgi:hypothetical protein
VAAADGSGAHKLVDMAANLYQPTLAWSPDGAWDSAVDRDAPALP